MELVEKQDREGSLKGSLGSQWRWFQYWGVQGPSPVSAVGFSFGPQLTNNNTETYY